MTTGGTVHFTLRLSDGREFRMITTNSFLDLIQDDAFLTEKPEAVNRIIENWKDIIADSQGKKDYYFANSVATAGIYPDAYGLVVVDFKSHTILSCLREKTLTDFNSAHLWIYENMMIEKHDSSDWDRIVALFTSGRIHGYNIKGKFVPFKPWSHKQPFNKERAEHWMQSDIKQFHNFRNYAIDLKPFTLEDFWGENKDPYFSSKFPPDKKQRMINRIRELGFIISPAELAHWDDED
jgi:hypothetical protein